MHTRTPHTQHTPHTQRKRAKTQKQQPEFMYQQSKKIYKKIIKRPMGPQNIFFTVAMFRQLPLSPVAKYTHSG